MEDKKDEFVIVNDEFPSYPLLPSDCTVFASNISMKATETSLKEFFGICGAIKKVSLQAINEGEKHYQTAIIVFDNDEAAKTAIFLNDTFIIDSAITVSPFKGEVPQRTNQTNQTNQQSTSQQTQQTQQPGFFVNALASAYIWGSKAWQKAVEFDDKHKITATIQEKANQVDNSLKISENTKIVVQKVTAASDSLDKSLGITENTNKLANKTADSYNTFKHRNEKTEKFFENLDSMSKKVVSTFEDTMKVAQQKVDLVKTEIHRREDEEKNAKIATEEIKEEAKEEKVANENTSLLTDTQNGNTNSTN
jgi:hypothetical protein